MWGGCTYPIMKVWTFAPCSLAWSLCHSEVWTITCILWVLLCCVELWAGADLLWAAQSRPQSFGGVLNVRSPGLNLQLSPHKNGHIVNLSESFHSSVSSLNDTALHHISSVKEQLNMHKVTWTQRAPRCLVRLRRSHCAPRVFACVLCVVASVWSVSSWVSWV